MGQIPRSIERISS